MAYAGRTVNGIPRLARTHAENPRLKVDGLVADELLLTPSDFDRLPHVAYLGSQTCNDSGMLPQTDWSGVRLSDLVALANPNADARYVRVSAGPYGVPIDLEQANDVLLCDRLSDEPLAVEHGGPWRLVVPDRRYFTSVKWVDRIEVTATEPDDSATRIAKARARARAAKSS